MRNVQFRSAATQGLAQRQLRIGAASLFFTAAALVAYIVWNVDLLRREWQPKDFDDGLLVCLAFLNTFTAFSLRRAAHTISDAAQDRVKAEDDAEKHRLWLETVVRQMPVGVGVLASPSGDLLFANDQYHHLLRPELAVPGDVPAIDARDTVVGSHDTIRKLSLQTLQRGLSVRDREVELLRGDGKRVWMSVSTAPIRDRAGDIAGAVVTFSDITERRAVAMERAVLMRGIINIQESERLRIARELHDELGQDIAGLRISLRALENTQVDEASRQTIQRLRSTVDGMNDHIHGLISRLRPLMLDDFGLRHALEELALAWSERLGVQIDVHLEGLSDGISDAIAIAVYRVVQEALTNIAKHADAATISVTAQLAEGALRVIVEDDGKGFDFERPQDPGLRQFGIAGMAERLSMVGGRLDIESKPGLGTTIYAFLPYAESVK